MSEKKNEITLDSLLDSRASHPALPDLEEEGQDLSQAVTQVSEEDREKINDIKDSINLQDSASLAVYGTSLQRNISNFSESVLSQVRSQEVGEVGDLMAELMVTVKDFDQDDRFLAKLPFLGQAKRKMDRYLARFDLVSQQVDKVVGELENAKMALLKDVSMLDRLYEQNVTYFKELQQYILAGEEVIQETRTQVLPRLYQEAEVSQDPMKVNIVKDLDGSIANFEKQVHDLKLTQTIILQNAPQIKMILNNAHQLYNRSESLIHNTIPIWKSQVILALGLEDQRKIVDLHKNISDLTNEMLRKNASQLKQTSLDVARESERSIVDVDTLKQVNQDLIETIQETMKIQEEGRQQRQLAEADLVKVEADLKAALLGAIGRKEQEN
ncbi:toxic anion resistance protein [Hutsoniella sourekii]